MAERVTAGRFLPARAVNWALYFVTFALIATGVATIGTNRADAGWVYEAHRYAGALLCALMIPKLGIILRAYGRRLRQGTWNEANTWGGLALTLLLLVSAVGALAWTLDLAPFWVQVVLVVTPLALHWYVGLALVPFFLWHVWARWIAPPRFGRRPRGRVEARYSRRQALGLLGAGALGAIGWAALEAAGNMTAWQRRFTGSRVVAEFTGNEFPVTQSDGPPAIALNEWRLEIGGNVARPLALTYAELVGISAVERTATLDCTLGWAATQAWRGVALGELLARAGWDGRAGVTVYATTGAAASLAPEDVRETMVATHVGGEPLRAAHGFPARLVTPSRRGYQWLKWVERVVVS